MTYLGPQSERIQTLVGDEAGIILPLPSATKIPLEEKQAAVRGALDLKLHLADIFDGETEGMVSRGEISPEAARKLSRLASGHTGIMLDFVHVAVGFEGNHGTDIGR